MQPVWTWHISIRQLWLDIPSSCTPYLLGKSNSLIAWSFYVLKKQQTFTSSQQVIKSSWQRHFIAFFLRRRNFFSLYYANASTGSNACFFLASLFLSRCFLPLCMFSRRMSYPSMRINFPARILSIRTSFLLVRALCILLSRNISLIRSLFIQYPCCRVFIALVVRDHDLTSHIIK